MLLNFKLEIKYFLYLYNLFKIKNFKLSLEFKKKNLIFFLNFKNFNFLIKKKCENKINKTIEFKLKNFNELISNNFVKFLEIKNNIFIIGDKVKITTNLLRLPNIININYKNYFIILNSYFFYKLKIFNCIKIKINKIDDNIYLIFFKKNVFLINFNEYNIILKFIKNNYFFSKLINFKISKDFFDIIFFSKKIILLGFKINELFFKKKYVKIKNNEYSFLNMNVFKIKYDYLLIKCNYNFFINNDSIFKIFLKNNFLYIIEISTKKIFFKIKIFLINILFLNCFLKSNNLKKIRKKEFLFFYNKNENFIICSNYIKKKENVFSLLDSI